MVYVNVSVASASYPVKVYITDPLANNSDTWTDGEVLRFVISGMLFISVKQLQKHDHYIVLKCALRGHDCIVVVFTSNLCKRCLSELKFESLSYRDALDTTFHDAVCQCDRYLLYNDFIVNIYIQLDWEQVFTTY